MEAAFCYGNDSYVQSSSLVVFGGAPSEGWHSCSYCLGTSLFVAEHILVSKVLDSAVLATQAAVAQQSKLATMLSGLDD